MINDKYRISEVAKDLNVPMKELVELLEKQFPGEKKRTTALSNEELNFVFETYTQKNQMDSLDSYYAYREESKVPQAKSKPEKEKKEQQHSQSRRKNRRKLWLKARQKKNCRRSRRLQNPNRHSQK